MTTPLNQTASPVAPIVDLDDEGCEDCGSVLPGVLTDMDFMGGIQRCDSCGRFDGDLEAAQAVADLVGGTVWFMAESRRRNAPEGVRTQWRGQDGVVLVDSNNPWVELDGVLIIWEYTRLLLDAPRHVVVAANKLASTWKLSSADLVEAVRAIAEAA